MICKTFEIRDRMTFIPAIAVKLQPSSERDRYLFGRSGYGTAPHHQSRYILLARLAGGNGHMRCDPYEWDTHTMKVAHDWIISHFDELVSGDVIDVEYITEQTAEPKRSEAEEVF